MTVPDTINLPPEYHGKYRIDRFTAEAAPELWQKAMNLRTGVFVEEQNVPPDEELDGYDAEALHWLVTDESGDALATARLLEFQEACQMKPVAKIGRVAVRKTNRGQGLGRLLVQVMLEHAENNGFDQAILGAQLTALDFYTQLGFEPEGDEFMDGGMPHLMMRKVF